jgi:hypothetical protein
MQYKVIRPEVEVEIQLTVSQETLNVLHQVIGQNNNRTLIKNMGAKPQDEERFDSILYAFFSDIADILEDHDLEKPI